MDQADAYALLAAELRADPDKAGYAGMTDQQAADSLNAATISAAVDVPASSVMAVLLASASWGKVELLSRESASGVAEHDAALIAAINLLRLVEQGVTIQMTVPATAAVASAGIAALAAHGTITQAAAAAVLALAGTTLSRAAQVGWPYGPVSAPDVRHARAA